MFKKGILIIAVYHFVGIALQSCLTCNDKAKIVGLRSSSIATLNYTPIALDEGSETYIITEPFRWLIHTEQEIIAVTNTAYNASYATEPCSINSSLNDLDSSSFKVYFSETFTYKNNTIRDSTNIHFLIHSNLSNEGQGMHEAFGFEFDSAFIENSIFDTNLIYTLHFTGFTTDSIQIADSIRLSFKLN